MVEVSRLIAPEMLVEIEVDALLPESAAAAGESVAGAEAPAAPATMPGPERTTIHELLEETRRGLVRLTPVEAAAAMAEGALLIDTRTNDDRARDGAVPGAALISRTTLEWRVDPASGYQDPRITGFDQPLIVMCNEGYSSSLAAATLQRLGFKRATDLIGGFRAWRDAGLPVERAAPPAGGADDAAGR